MKAARSRTRRCPPSPPRRSSARSISSSPARASTASRQAAAKIAGVGKVHVADDAAYANALAENVAPLIVELMGHHDAFIAPATTTGKNIAPRVAALLDVMQISDILSVESDDTFTRPIYAGNAIATVKSSDAKKVITVRGTAFDKAATEGGSGTIEKVSATGDKGLSSFVGSELSKSERPELTSAKVIVSGGRAFGSSEQFHALLDPLADKLGAGVGASRAAVDAGYAPNDYQVGQTGKIVAPEVYIAIGISGRDPAPCGDEGFEDDRRDQQGRGRPDLPGRRCRPGRRPVQDRPRADREIVSACAR